MTASRTLFALGLVLGFGAGLRAQGAVAAPPLPRYPGIKTQFNRSLSQPATNEQRLDLYRQTVALGLYSGSAMSTRMFGDFQSGAFRLSSTTPGLATTVRLLASDNRNVVLGTARTSGRARKARWKSRR